MVFGISLTNRWLRSPENCFRGSKVSPCEMQRDSKAARVPEGKVARVARVLCNTAETLVSFVHWHSPDHGEFHLYANSKPRDGPCFHLEIPTKRVIPLHPFVSTPLPGDHLAPSTSRASSPAIIDPPSFSSPSQTEREPCSNNRATIE